jgi:hypothetical protein
MTMATVRSRSIKEGIGYGIVAGIIFGAMEMLGARLMGDPAIAPLRMFASIVLGQDALAVTAPGTAIVVGTVVHLILSGIFGLVYGLVNSRFSREIRTERRNQAVLGLLYGTALWLVNFQFIARLFYPWFLELPQLLQLGMHVLFFGIPLALMYGGAERRAVVEEPEIRRAA